MSMRALTLMLVLAPFGCSLLVDAEVEDVQCEGEGSIGPPACDVGEICARNRCHDCLASDVCGDGIDNDCSGRVDEGCGADAAAGSAGAGNQ